MKTFSTLLFILLLQGRLWSQPVFNMQDLYSTGTHYVTRLHTWNLFPLDTGNAGANQNWNFAQTVFTLIDTLDIVTIAQSPLGQVLPGDRVLLRNSGNINAAYLGISGNTLLHHGDAGSSSQLPRLHGMPQMQFPLTFGQSNSGQYATVTAFYIGIPLGTPYVVDSVRRRTVTHYQYTFDAYGSVTTPLGTFTALRKRLWTYEVDSADFYRADLGVWVNNAESSEAEALTFEFYTPGFQLPIIRLVDMGNDAWIDETEYLYVFPLGLETPVINKLHVSLYPNPTSGMVHLEGELEPKASATVLNAGGQVLKEHLSIGEDPKLDLSHLPAGLYLIRVQNGGQSQSIRLLKE